MTLMTIIAQIINFLLFVLILYWLLYKPVRRIMKQRQDAMEADLRRAEEQRSQAERLRAEADELSKEVEATRDRILKEARERAEQARKELLAQTEEQARDRIERFRRVMEQERTDLLETVSEELRETIVTVAGSILRDVSSELADRGIDRVEALLADLSEKERDGAVESLAKHGRRVHVRAAGGLNDAQAGRLRAAIMKELAVTELELDVEDAPELLAGLEVDIGHLNLEAHWRGAIEQEIRSGRGFAV
jgi:F-type H+-transporting ATPase subunit b